MQQLPYPEHCLVKAVTAESPCAYLSAGRERAWWPAHTHVFARAILPPVGLIPWGPADVVMTHASMPGLHAEPAR
jgi:hypothetical protein